MSVNIQQADKTLKKVADTTVVNKSTVTTALGYTPVTSEQLSTAKTELTNSINTTKTDLTNSINEVGSNLSTTANNLQQQIDALEGSSFDGDYNKLKNAPILNDADGTATFADETGNIIARIDNNGLETTNLNLHGDIELVDEKLEIIDETGNIVLRIDNNGVETKTTNELKTKIGDIDAQAKANASSIQKIQEDLATFNFEDEGGLTVTDEQGNIIAKFGVEVDAEGKVTQTGLITTDVTFEYEENKTKTLTALNAEVVANAEAIEKNTKGVSDNAAAIATKASIDSPEFTGTPKAPSPIDNSNQRVATTDYVENAVAGLQEDIGDVFDFNDDGALIIADEAGNILAQFAVEEDAQGNVIETGLKVTDVIVGSAQTSVTKKFSDIDSALGVRYTKGEVYTKSETDSAINTAVANAEHLKRIIVDALPTTGIDERAIYMVKAASTETSDRDVYDEYMYINNAWERLGSWQTDLTDYAKETFKAVKVGDINVEADSNADTLTLVAGNNVTITASAENDTITISSTNTGFTTFGIEGEGNAITNITTPKPKVLTFIKGETFATKQEYTDFKTGFEDRFDFKTDENSLDITDGNNIIATFDDNGLRTTTVILGNTNSEVLIDLMNIDYDSLFAFDVNEIVGGETSPVELASDELLLTDLDGDYVVVKKGE